MKSTIFRFKILKLNIRYFKKEFIKKCSKIKRKTQFLKNLNQGYYTTTEILFILHFKVLTKALS